MSFLAVAKMHFLGCLGFLVVFSIALFGFHRYLCITVIPTSYQALLKTNRLKI